MTARYCQQHTALTGRSLGQASKLGLCLLFSSLTLSVWILAPRLTAGLGTPPLSAAFVEDRLDARLLQVAREALGEREGTIVVIDPQTGRVRAVVNPELAFQNAYPPGSTIKPFTALAGLRSGLIDRTSRTLCREKYHHDDFTVVCSHPRELAPLNPTEAIAYSCNYYFARLGERLSEAEFDATLSDFGFGQKTGISFENETPGRLLRGEWRPQNAIGEGAYLQVSPVQLIVAFAALVNGGHLMTPATASAKNFMPKTRSDIYINDEQRSTIIEGMRGAVRYGTAERADLNSLPLYIIGKTGTSTPIYGFRTQGWFVGFAASTSEQPGPAKVGFGVVVYLKNSHGAEAAELSKPIFEEFAREAQTGEEETANLVSETPKFARSAVATFPVSQPSLLRVWRPVISVHQVRDNKTVTLTLEDYVLGVVAAEGSMEHEPEALKAVAIAARTYALKNIGRHKGEGYDFCSTTHCQRFVGVEETDLRSSHTLPANAVRDTAGLVLVDDQGHIAESYFGASCGGMTANLQTLWGARAPSYLRGVSDEYCKAGAHHAWTDVITSDRMAQALRGDPRTDVGGSIRALAVARRDQTGRAEVVEIEGNSRRTISGWEFKLIVGRALGWNVLKSSRFDVERAGSSFVFHGSGFGHGLGLCQEGAHVMAQQGLGYRQILTKYFPGTRVRNVSTQEGSELLVLEETGIRRSSNDNRYSNESQTDLLWDVRHRRSPVATLPAVSAFRHPAPSLSLPRRSSSSEHFRLSYPQTISNKNVEGLLRLLESTRSALLQHVTTAGIEAQFPYVEVSINETTGDFVGRTGQPWWAAAATRGRQIELQPLAVLQRRAILETTLRHELVHVLIDRVSAGGTPRWLSEGLALNVAGEGPMILRFRPGHRIPVDELEQKFALASSADEMRAAYAAAYDEVRQLIETDGEGRVWQRLAGRRN